MLHPRVATAFQNIDEADQIGIGIGMRVGDRVAHPRLRGQMHHAIKPVLIEESGHGRPVGQIDFAKGKARLPLKSSQSRQLERRIVIIVEIVDADHPRTRGQQTVRDMHADEACGTGHQDRHRSRRSSHGPAGPLRDDRWRCTRVRSREAGPADTYCDRR